MTNNEKDLELWHSLQKKLCRPGDAPIKRDRGGRYVIETPPKQAKRDEKKDGTAAN